MIRMLTIFALLSQVAHAQEPPSEPVDAGPVSADSPVDDEGETTEDPDSESDETSATSTPEADPDLEGTDPDTPTETSTVRSDLPEIEYVEVDAEILAQEQAMAAEQLVRYCEKAHTVLIGPVLTVYEQDNEQRVSLLVEEGLRGRPRGAIDISIPAPIVTTDPTRIYPKVVEGYRMLVFVTRQGKLIEGNSLFLVQGGFVWRNKRPDAFLQPSSNQDWVEQVDPSQDYIMFSLDEVRACLE